MRWAMLAAIGVGGGLSMWLAGAQVGPTASASAPPELAATWDHLSTFRTLYQRVGVGILRVDAAAPAFTYDLYGGVNGGDRSDEPTKAPRGRLSWDGQSLYWGPEGGEPVELPQLYADRVSEVWALLRSGGEGIALAPATPSQLPKGTRNPPNYTAYVVNTPFPWDDDYTLIAWLAGQYVVYLSVTHPNGEPVVASGVWLGRFAFPTGPHVLKNVPLDPDLFDPYMPEPYDQHAIQDPARPAFNYHGGVRQRRSDDGMYHDNLRRVWLQTIQASQVWPVTSALTVDTCDAGPSSTKDVVYARWGVVPSGDVGARIAAAQAECDRVHFHMGFKPTLISRKPHVSSCFEGTWRVLDTATTPETVLWEKTYDVCAQGTPKVLPYVMDADMSMTGDLSALQVEIDGTMMVDCLSTGDGGGAVRLYLTRAPVLSWDCFPGWDPSDPD
jgi:hypothetical protein